MEEKKKKKTPMCGVCACAGMRRIKPPSGMTDPPPTMCTACLHSHRPTPGVLIGPAPITLVIANVMQTRASTTDPHPRRRCSRARRPRW